MFFDVYCELCKEKGISPTGAALEMGISRGAVSAWKNEARVPSSAILTKIADYFGVSVDYLLGNEEKPASQEADELIKSDPLAGQLFAAYGRVKEEFSQAEIDDITMIMEMLAEKKRRKREKGEE